jgi:tetratricopeptide (TPR) repeat protein
LGAPALVLGLAELALRLVGYGYSTRFFEPHPDGLHLTTNPHFAWQYFDRETATAPTPLLFAARTPTGTRRIFVLGESAAAGTPDPAFSAARMLDLMLRAQYPSHRFEVVNAAMRGVNSHIIRHIARECAALAPDLFIVYLGNNELIGLHAPTPTGFNFAEHPWLLRLGEALKATRLAQLTRSLRRRLGPNPPQVMQDMEYLRRQRLAFDAPRRQAAYKNFQANLDDICEIARRRGARTILATVSVNQRDFPPLASLHRSDLAPGPLADFERVYAQGAAAESAGQTNAALVHFEAAARLDDHYADLHFRLARCYEATGRIEPARRHYALARDWDALQFRADSRVNAIVRQTADRLRAQRVTLADAEAAFAASPLADHGTPGRKLFNDHVHFSFDGDYQLARLLLPSVTAALGLATNGLAPPTRDECARALAFTPIDEMNVLAAMAQQTAKPPFLDRLEHAQRQADAEKEVRERLSQTTTPDFERAVAVYREALARRPDDWMLRYNLGNLFTQFSRFAEAAAEYELVVQRQPRQRVFRLNYGHALLQSGRPAEALAQYRAALDIDPDFTPAKAAIDSVARGRR